MVTFLERKQPTLGEKLAAGIERGAEKGMNFAQEMNLQEMKQKKEEKMAKGVTLQSLDHTINQMEGLIDKGGIGLLGQFNPMPDAQFNRGQMQTLKGELLNYYKSLFPRGLTQQEFTKLERDYLPGIYDTKEGMKGKLQGFKDLIKRKLELEGNEDSSEKSPNKKPKKEKLTDSVVDQLLEETNGDVKQAKKLAADRGYTW
jgi:hypothetical protein